MWLAPPNPFGWPARLNEKRPYPRAQTFLEREKEPQLSISPGRCANGQLPIGGPAWTEQIVES